MFGQRTEGHPRQNPPTPGLLKGVRHKLDSATICLQLGQPWALLEGRSADGVLTCSNDHLLACDAAPL